MTEATKKAYFTHLGAIELRKRPPQTNVDTASLLGYQRKKKERNAV